MLLKMNPDTNEEEYFQKILMNILVHELQNDMIKLLQKVVWKMLSLSLSPFTVTR